MCNILDVNIDDLENGYPESVVTGRYVARLLGKFTSLKGKSILDFGGGGGGTSAVLSYLGGNVTYVDIDKNKKYYVDYLKSKFTLHFDTLSYDEYKSQRDEYDITVMRDVVEHLQSENVLREVLGRTSSVYIETPNLLSPYLVLKEPHTGFFFVSIMPRKIRNRVYRLFRVDKSYTDVKLYSVFGLVRILKQAGFDDIKIVTGDLYDVKNQYNKRFKKCLISYMIYLIRNHVCALFMKYIISPSIGIYATKILVGRTGHIWRSDCT